MWPPPEHIYISGNETLFSLEKAEGRNNNQKILIRRNMSQLTDKEADSSHIARGAEYFYLKGRVH